MKSISKTLLVAEFFILGMGLGVGVGWGDAVRTTVFSVRGEACIETASGEVPVAKAQLLPVGTELKVKADSQLVLWFMPGVAAILGPNSSDQIVDCSYSGKVRRVNILLKTGSITIVVVSPLLSPDVSNLMSVTGRDGASFACPAGRALVYASDNHFSVQVAQGEGTFSLGTQNIVVPVDHQIGVDWTSKEPEITPLADLEKNAAYALRTLIQFTFPSDLFHSNHVHD